MNRALIVVLAGALVLALAGAGFQTYRLNSTLRDLRETRITAANNLAKADSSRLALRLEGDSVVAVAERLAFQLEGEIELRAAFEDSLERVGKVAAELAIKADSLERHTETLAARDTAGAITVADTFNALDSLGVKADAAVRIEPDLRAFWTWHIIRAEISLELALSCVGDQAVAQLAGPPWAPLELGRVEQVAELCIPPIRPSFNAFGLRLPSLPVALAIFLAGVVAAP